MNAATIIVSSIMGGLTAIVIAGLQFVRWTMQGDIDEEIEEKKSDGLVPYFLNIVGSPCPICGMPTAIKGERINNTAAPATQDAGIIYMPKVCDDKSCRVKSLHLHGRCVTCGGTFAMRPRAVKQ